MANAVTVEISATVGEFQRQLNDASRMLRDAAKDMGGAVKETGDAATGSGKAFSSFTDILKEHKTEMRQESGLARVLSRDLAALGLDAKGAGGEIAHLIGGFAIGGGLGLAMASIKVVSQLFKELTKEEEASKEALQKWFDTMDTRAGKAADDVRQLFNELNNLSRADLLAEKAAVSAKFLKDATEEVRKQEQAVADLKEQFKSVGSENEAQDLVAQISIATAKLQEKRREEATAKKVADTEATAADYARQVEANKAAADGAKERLRIQKQADAERDREQEKKIHQEEQQTRQEVAAEEAHDALLTQTKLRWAKKAVDDETAMRLQFAADMEKLGQIDADDRRKLEADLQREINKIREKAFDDNEKKLQEKRDFDARENKKAIDTMARDTERFLGPVGRAFGNTFAGIIDGTKDVGKAFVDMGKSLLTSQIDALANLLTKEASAAIATELLKKTEAVSAITKSAGEGGAAAAASTASIPLIGPFLAVEAGLAMTSAIEGAFLPFAAAAGGMDVGWTSPITQLHPREMVLPQPLADGVRGMVESGGTGGGGTIVIHAVDAQSFEDAFRRNATPAIRVLREWASQGRM